MAGRRAVITGLGAVTPVGSGVKAFWQALREGVPGIDRITLFDPSPYPCQVAAEVRDFDPRACGEERSFAALPRFVQFGVAAAGMAWEAAGLGDAGAGVPVCFGSSTAAVREFQDLMVEFAARGMRRRAAAVMVDTLAHAVTSHVAASLHLTGQTVTLHSGCASGLDAVGWAWDRVRTGRAAVILVGAADAPLATSLFATWASLGLLSRWPGPPAQSLRPFDALSSGTVLGEGAAALVVEELEHARARGARPYAEILGHGSSSAGLGTADPSAPSLREAVGRALAAARVRPVEVDYVSTHGGGVPAYDRAESAAYRALFGEHAYHIPVSSIKPVTGNSFAAAGALQVVAACLSLDEQFVPPTLNHDIPDATCDLDYVPNRGRPARIRRLVVAARAIGPTHSALVLGPPPCEAGR